MFGQEFKSDLKFNLHVHIKFCCFLAILFPSNVLRTAIYKWDQFLKEKRY